MNSPSTGKWIADSTSNDNRKLRLSELRRKRGITRQKLAFDLNMARSTVSRYESETPSSCGATKRDAGAWLTGKPRQAVRNAPARYAAFFPLYNNSSFLLYSNPTAEISPARAAQTLPLLVLFRASEKNAPVRSRSSIIFLKYYF